MKLMKKNNEKKGKINKQAINSKSLSKNKPSSLSPIDQTLRKRDHEKFENVNETNIIYFANNDLVIPKRNKNKNKTKHVKLHYHNYEDFFKNMKDILPRIFLNMKVPKEDYDKCSTFEKVCMKHFLIKKLGVDSSIVDLSKSQINFNNPLSFNHFFQLTQITSNKRKNEAIEHIMKLFIDEQISVFINLNISKFGEKLKNPLFTKIKFFQAHFNLNNEVNEKLKVIMSTFIKAKLLKNPKYKSFLKKPKEYSKNYNFMKMLEFIKRSPSLNANFVNFLDKKYKKNVFTIYEKKIKFKFNKKFVDMEHDLVWNCKNKRELFLPYFINQLKSIKYKMPMMILDLLKFTRVIKNTMGIELKE
jgi:hypothetical protein